MNQPETPAQIGKYRIDSILGEGAMGVVYRGREPISGTVVAIKTIKLASIADGEKREMLERFRREGSAGASLSHPNVVRIHELGEADGLAYIVMNFVAGESLRTLNARKGRWPLFEALHLADQLLEAIDYFHKRGIVHRDIKPSNIMVDELNRLTVTDLGIVRTENSTLTQVGTVLGSPWYMSPEQITEMPLDSRSDLFSVGIILYELITGRNPFKAEHLIAVLDNIVVRPLVPPSSLAPDLPVAVNTLFEQALAKQPQDRFQSGAEFRAALQQMLAELLPKRDSVAGWGSKHAAADPPANTAQPTQAASQTQRSIEAATMLATLELGLHDNATRNKPRSRALLWLIGGLMLSGALLLALAPAPQPVPRPVPPLAPVTKPVSPDTAAPLTTPSSEPLQEADMNVGEILRQCGDPQVVRVLIPNINGIVRCNKNLVCTWDTSTLGEMHRRLSVMFSTDSKAAGSAGNSAYLEEIGCIAGLTKAVTPPTR